MKRRTIIIIIVSALVLAGLAFGIVSAQQRQQVSTYNLQTFEISYGALSAVVDETGEVYAEQTAMMFWKTTGIVGEVTVELGEEVVAEQILATLNKSSLPQTIYIAQQELINAERALENLFEGAAEAAASSQLALANARDALDDAEYRWTLNQPGNRASDEELKSAKAKVTIANKRLTQAKKRKDNASGKIANAQAQISLTNAINQYQSAVWYLNWLKVGADEIEMAIFDANVAVGLANLETAEREYDRLKDGPDPDDISIAEARIAGAQASLDAVFITAPFDGVITAVEVLPGDLVVPNSLAFRIDNLNNLLVDVAVSEVDINQISVGQPVTLAFDAILGKEYQGEVVSVSPVGILQQGLVSFEVTIKVLDADEEVRPGLTAAIQIVVRQVEDALLIPNRVVRWVNGEQVVYVSTTGEAPTVEDLNRIPVTLGASSDEFTELLEGELQEGDFLVLNPPSISIFDEMESGMGSGMGPPGGIH